GPVGAGTIAPFYRPRRLTARPVARAHRHEKTPALVLGFGRRRIGRGLGGFVLARFVLRGTVLAGFVRLSALRRILARRLLARSALLCRRLAALWRLADANPSCRDDGHRVLHLLGPNEEARLGEEDQDPADPGHARRTLRPAR